jgi:transcriptional regulator with XRE-family HTH domain
MGQLRNKTAVRSRLSMLAYRKLIGLRLESVRNSRNETLNQVAEAAGISRRTLRRIEKSEVNWKILAVARLCWYYDIKLNVLFAKGNHRKIKI